MPARSLLERHGTTIAAGLSIRELLRHGQCPERDGVFYCSEAPVDMAPEPDDIHGNPGKWSVWRKENYAFLERELDVCDRDALVIDLGAGVPSIFRDVSSRFRTCLVDIYPYPGIRVIADFNRPLPFRDGVADVAIVSNILEHLAEPDRFLGECHRILKPGGMLVGTVPFLRGIHQRPYDYYRFTDMSLQYLLAKHRFTATTIRPVLMPYHLISDLMATFFIRLIQKTTFSRRPAVQSAYILFLRTVWKIQRLILKTLSWPKIYLTSNVDPDTPLGYLFSARRDGKFQ